MNICVVCSGNICRSPFAEAVIKKHLSDHQVYSAGTLDLYGHPAYEVCVELAPEFGVSIASHQSQGLSKEVAEKSDILLVMTRYHRIQVEQKFSEYLPKVKLMGNYMPENKTYSLGILGKVQQGDDIPDPMGSNAQIVKPVLEVINEASLRFVEEVKNNGDSSQ